MPTYTITLKIAVPGLGIRTVPIPNVEDVTLEKAIEQARSQVTVETVAGEKTTN